MPEEPHDPFWQALNTIECKFHLDQKFERKLLNFTARNANSWVAMVIPNMVAVDFAQLTSGDLAREIDNELSMPSSSMEKPAYSASPAGASCKGKTLLNTRGNTVVLIHLNKLSFSTEAAGLVIRAE